MTDRTDRKKPAKPSQRTGPGIFKKFVNRLLGTAMRRAKAANLRMDSLATPFDRAALEGAELLTDRDELLARLPKGGVGVEVGVAMGDFTARILERARPELLYLIDAWHMKEDSRFGLAGMAYVCDRFASEIAAETVVVMRGWSHEKLEEIADGTLDWIYVDAGHDYDSVKRDLQLAHRKIKPEGVICGDDYVRWGRFGKRFGVVEAVNEFAAANGYRLRFLTMEANRNPSYALMRKPG